MSVAESVISLVSVLVHQKWDDPEVDTPTPPLPLPGRGACSLPNVVGSKSSYPWPTTPPLVSLHYTVKFLSHS